MVGCPSQAAARDRLGSAFDAGVDSLSSLGYLRVWRADRQPATILGPAGFFAVQPHTGTGIAEAIAAVQAASTALEQLAVLEAGSVQPVLCLTSRPTSGHGQVDGVDIVTGGRLRAWLMLRPVLLSAPQVQLLNVRINRRSGIRAPTADSAA